MNRLGCALVLASVAWSAEGRAEMPPPMRDPLLAPEARVQTIRPNPILVETGIFALALSYAPAAYVAASSEHAGDRYLYVPVAGPWLDLARRRCSIESGPRCGTTPSEKIGLVASGAGQLIGVAHIVASFILPAQRVILSASTWKGVRFEPAAFGLGGYGLSAAGVF